MRKTKRKEFKKLKNKKIKNTRKNNLGSGPSPKNNIKLERQDSIEAREILKQKAEDDLDELYDNIVDRRSQANVYRHDKKRNEDRIVEEQRAQLLETPFNIFARQVHNSKKPSLKTNIVLDETPKIKSKKKKQNLNLEELDISNDGQLSPNSFDQHLELILNNPSSSTPRDVKSNKKLTLKEKKYSRIDDETRNQLLATARELRSAEGKGIRNKTIKKRKRKKKKKKK